MPTQWFESIHDYLEELPGNKLEDLYSNPASCLAVFRYISWAGVGGILTGLSLLPPLSKHLILSLLFVELVEKITLEQLLQWVIPTEKRTWNESLSKLKRLQILAWSKDGNIKVNETFRTHFRYALTTGGEKPSFGLHSTIPDKHQVTIDHLDEFAEHRWEVRPLSPKHDSFQLVKNILHFMVGTADVRRPPSSAATKVLEDSGLLRRDVNQKLRITHSGFRFLLMERQAQVWVFLLQYLESAEKLLGDTTVEMLQFLFLLGGLQLGKDYSMDTLTEVQKAMIEDLQDYGLVYRRKKGSRRFYPTRLATTLTSDGELHDVEGTRDKPEEGYILLETNYRLYAYSSSPLQIAILNLFCELNCRFGNLLTGFLTRDSCRGAFQNGITAEQIITYLEVHAHPQMRKKTPVLPLTVIDQIRLWEIERNRFSSVKGNLYLDFGSDQSFEEFLEFAESIGAVEWSGPRMMVINEKGNEEVKAYISGHLHQQQNYPKKKRT